MKQKNKTENYKIQIKFNKIVRIKKKIFKNLNNRYNNKIKFQLLNQRYK